MEPANMVPVQENTLMALKMATNIERMPKPTASKTLMPANQ